MTPADLQIPEREGAPVVDDPAVVAAKKAKEAAAAFSAIAKTCRTSDDENTPEFVVADKRTTEADAAFADAPVTSVAGALAKMRELVDLDADDNGTSLNTKHIRTVIAFLEGRMVAAEPDPVVTLFAKWGTLQDEALALHKTDPEAVDPHIEKKRDELYDRQSAIERQIIDTPATSVGGIAVKLRLLAYIEFPMKGLPDLHRTPAKDTDFKGMIEAWRDDSGLDWQDDLLIGALRDAERLAGAS